MIASLPPDASDQLVEVTLARSYRLAVWSIRFLIVVLSASLVAMVACAVLGYSKVVIYLLGTALMLSFYAWIALALSSHIAGAIFHAKLGGTETAREVRRFPKAERTVLRHALRHSALHRRS
jgi:hypothetical protein